MASILEERAPLHFKEELKQLIKLLTPPGAPKRLQLKGSAGLTSQQYPSDFDLFSDLSEADYSPNKFVAFLKSLLAAVDQHPDCWFVELKVQTKSGKKVRLHPGDKLDALAAQVKKLWPQLDIIKIDLIARIEGQFSEVSAIYKLAAGDAAPADATAAYRRSLEDDIKELSAEKRWYKVLKRQFNLTKTEPPSAERSARLKQLSKVFNGPLGELYQTLSRLEAIETVVGLYPDAADKARLAIKDMHLPAEALADPDEWAERSAKEMNSAAKKIVQ
jgi:hypothetical protein